MIPTSLNRPASSCTDLSKVTQTQSDRTLPPPNPRLMNAPTDPPALQVPGLVYQFLLRADGSVSFLFLSSSCMEFFGLEPTTTELDTPTLVSLLHPEDKAGFYDSIETAAFSLQPWRWVGRFILPSGQTKWIQWDAQPSLQTNGNIFWNGLLVDVTSQHQLNNEVKRLSFLLGLTERLQSSTQLDEIADFALTYLVQATGSAFGDVKVIRDTEQPSCYAHNLRNFVSGEFVATYGKPAVAEMESLLHQGIPQGQGLLWQVVETGKPVFVDDYANHPNAVSTFRHPAIGQIGIFPIPATNGTVIGVLTLESRNLRNLQNSSQQDLLLAACQILGVCIERANDRDRLHQANAILEQNSRELENTLGELQHAQTQLIQSEKMSSLGQLVAGVAHEINNPVSFIQGNLPYAQLYFRDLLNLLKLFLDRYPKPDPEIQTAKEQIEVEFLMEDLPKLLESMQVGAERIKNIVRSLRNFSRLDEAEMKYVNLHEGIDNTLLILGSRLKAKTHCPKIEVIKDYGKLPPIECNAGQLNQVFMNLLSNAIDALEEKWQNEPNLSPSKTPKIWIHTEVAPHSQIQIRIADNGSGIPPSVQQRLFDPFFTTKPVGQGTGLGLSISYQIVTEKHKGQLQCRSMPDEGTEFVILIPLEQTAQSQLVA